MVANGKASASSLCLRERRGHDDFLTTSLIFFRQ
jgi:hypothetical protein